MPAEPGRHVDGAADGDVRELGDDLRTRAGDVRELGDDLRTAARVKESIDLGPFPGLVRDLLPALALASWCDVFLSSFVTTYLCKLSEVEIGLQACSLIGESSKAPLSCSWAS